jgi:drug/metabolite transporter (DMT)-like permease
LFSGRVSAGASWRTSASAFWKWWHFWAPSTAGGAGVFVGVGCSGLAYLCWYTSIVRASASSVASLLYLEPLVTLAGGVLLLGESVGVTMAGAGLLALAGVYLVKKRIDDAGGRTGGFGRHEVSGRVAP